MSLNEGMSLILPSGHKINVVRPEAWVFHKGLTFVKRVSVAKKYKDLYGILFVLSQLKDVSIATQKALPKLINKNTRAWEQTFKSNLKKWMAEASPKDWQILESQDGEGRLTQSSFVQLINSVID